MKTKTLLKCMNVFGGTLDFYTSVGRHYSINCWVNCWVNDVPLYRIIGTGMKYLPKYEFLKEWHDNKEYS